MESVDTRSHPILPSNMEEEEEDSTTASVNRPV